MSNWGIWRERMPGMAPVGYLLRDVLRDRWVRTHNLSEGKRWPRSEEDMAEVLYRNNMIASAVLGIGAKCSIYKGATKAEFEDALLPLKEWNRDTYWTERLEHIRFVWRPAIWRPGMVDDEIAQVASDQLTPYSIISHATSGIYCPYDGGADLFMASVADVASVRRLFQKWLSPDPSGL